MGWGGVGWSGGRKAKEFRGVGDFADPDGGAIDYLAARLLATRAPCGRLHLMGS